MSETRTDAAVPDVSATMSVYDVFTSWGHRARIEAESVEHAKDLFTGRAWPPGVPPCPRPAQRLIPDSGGRSEPTPEWQAWYRDKFLPVRAAYPVLAWEHGECMSLVQPAGQSVCHGQQNGSSERWVECAICCVPVSSGDSLLGESG